MAKQERDIVVRMASANDRCAATLLDANGCEDRKRRCVGYATMIINGAAYCDDHAARVMQMLCGRPVEIRRR